MYDLISQIGTMYTENKNRAKDIVINNLDYMDESLKDMNGNMPVNIFCGFVLCLKYTKEYLTFNIDDSFDGMCTLDKINKLCELF